MAEEFIVIVVISRHEHSQNSHLKIDTIGFTCLRLHVRSTNHKTHFMLAVGHQPKTANDKSDGRVSDTGNKRRLCCKINQPSLFGDILNGGGGGERNQSEVVVLVMLT